MKNLTTFVLAAVVAAIVAFGVVNYEKPHIAGNTTGTLYD